MQRMTRNPGDRLFGLDCACGRSRTFTVEPAAVVCADCKQRRPCTPPVIGVEDRPCSCGPMRTFIFDVAGHFTCTACGAVTEVDLVG